MLALTKRIAVLAYAVQASDKKHVLINMYIVWGRESGIICESKYYHSLILLTMQLTVLIYELANSLVSHDLFFFAVNGVQILIPLIVQISRMILNCGSLEASQYLRYILDLYNWAMYL